MESITLLVSFVALATAQAPSNAGLTPEQMAAQNAAREKASMLNEDFQNYIMIICGGLAVFFIIWRVTMESIKYVRMLTCLNNDSQRYFAIPSLSYANFKKHLLYAPVLGKRHNREFKLSSAINVGTLPTRFQLLFLMAYLATNVAFCVLSIDWSAPFSTVAGNVRNRTGILSVVNMVPLFIMAARNNPLINWLNISFDTFNLLHRWFGRIVVVEAMAHTGAWMASTVYRKGWAAVGTGLAYPALMWGMIATAAFVVLAIQASSIFRHAAYEFFKHVHIALALLSIVGLWYHLKMEEATQIKLLYGVVGIWILERSLRIFKILYRNGTGSRTLVEALPDGAARVTIDMPRPWRFKPGHHAYLYFPTIGLWTSHPFSVAWSQESTDAALMADEKLAMNRQDILAMQSTSMSYIIRARTGLTKKLIAKAEASPDGRFVTKSFAEGPYGGMHMMHSYGTVMLFAGGVGITHQVPHIRDLVAGFSNGTVAARKIVLVWIIQSPEHLEWIRPWMTSILAMDRRRECLKIMLFVSRPRNTKEIHSPSATVQMFPGRPDIGVLVDAEMEGQVGALGVSVCGAGSLSDDVRRVVRDRQGRGNVDFVEEAFSW